MLYDRIDIRKQRNMPMFRIFRGIPNARTLLSLGVLAGDKDLVSPHAWADAHPRRSRPAGAGCGSARAAKPVQHS
jgi:hypothetical protein